MFDVSVQPVIAGLTRNLLCRAENIPPLRVIDVELLRSFVIMLFVIFIIVYKSCYFVYNLHNQLFSSYFFPFQK